jgi:hypothetical protein
VGERAATGGVEVGHVSREVELVAADAERFGSQALARVPPPHALAFCPYYPNRSIYFAWRKQ